MALVNLKDIDIERVSLKNELEGLQEALQLENDRLDKQELKIKEKLVKDIKKLFGIFKPIIIIDKFSIAIKHKGEIILSHKYGSTTFNNIEPNVSKQIVAMYENVFGELEESNERFAINVTGMFGIKPYTSSCGTYEVPLSMFRN